MSNGSSPSRSTIRMPGAGGTNHGPQHSQSLESMFAHDPGLVVAMPSTACRRLLDAAPGGPLDDPVIFLESKYLYFRETGGIDETARPRTRIRRTGQRRAGRGCDGASAPAEWCSVCLEAAELLEAEGTRARWSTLRYIWPLDTETIAASLKRTGRLAVVHEAVEFGGWGAEVAAWALRAAFRRSRRARSCGSAPTCPDSIPAPPRGQVVPTVERITSQLATLGSH